MDSKTDSIMSLNWLKMHRSQEVGNPEERFQIHVLEKKNMIICSVFWSFTINK